MTATARAADEAGVIKKSDHASATAIEPTIGLICIDWAMNALSQLSAGVVTLARPKKLFEIFKSAAIELT